MTKNKKNYRLFRQNDIIIIVSIITAALFMSAYPNPFVVAGLIVLGIIVMRLIDAPKGDENEDGEPIETPEDEILKSMSPEEIVLSKFDNGALQKAVDERTDKLMQDIVNDVFGDYSTVTRAIKEQISNQMIPHIESYNYGDHAIKLEHLLNNVMAHVTADSSNLIDNLNTLLDNKKIETASIDNIVDAYSKHVVKNIETDDLEIDYDDGEPRYMNLTINVNVDDHELNTISRSSNIDRKRITLSCEEDEDFNTIIDISRWNENSGIRDRAWHIETVLTEKDNSVSYRTLINRDSDKQENILDLSTPLNNLKDLTDFELYMLKAYYDKAAIEPGDNTSFEVEAEMENQPEASWN